MEKTPIQILAEALAEMTGRAVEAERQLAEEKASSDTWYAAYNNLKAEYEKLQRQQKQPDCVNQYKADGGASNVPF